MKRHRTVPTEKTITRRQFNARCVQTLGAIALAGAAPLHLLAAKPESPSESPTAPPNVLFIAIDDMNSDVEAFDNPDIKTPNLVALAQRGTAFDRAYCQFPLCSPSRTSVITGLRPETNRVLGNNIFWRKENPDAVALPQHFSENGYESVLVGKLLHGQESHAAAGWDRMINHLEGIDQLQKEGRKLIGEYETYLAEGKTMPPLLKFFQYGPSGLDGVDMLDGRFVHQAVKYLSQKHEKPFFLSVGFGNPHLPWSAPDRFFDMYPPENVKLPENPSGDLDDLPEPAKPIIMKEMFGKKVSPELTREILAAYQACCTYVDSCVGQVLDALKVNGLEENTIVVVWSDHGSMLGNHQSWGKNCLFEQACRVPLIIAAPGVQSEKAHRSPRPVELLDLYPTLIDLCALPVRDELEGASLVPLLRDPDRIWTNAAFSTMKPKDGKWIGRSVRTERWRYSEYERLKGEAVENQLLAELYDHKNDPGEFKNLATDPKHAKVVAELSQTLKQGRKQSTGPSK